MSTPDKDPLRALGSRVLRQIARHLKIKHYYRKSPSKLRRAIHRACVRKDGQTSEQYLQNLVARFTGEPVATTTSSAPAAPQNGMQAAVKALRDPLKATLFPKKDASKAASDAPGQKTTAPKPIKNIRALEEEIEARRAAERKAIEEHRLRYLFSPSQFVHKGTHDEYILEKDEDIELPDFYEEQELVALPIDPYRFYVYWDFDVATEHEIKTIMAQAPDVFMLKISDVTGLMYNGENAHTVRWVPCDPRIKEWYLDTDWHDRNVCVELGHRHANGFKVLLRSNTVYIPPATVSPIRQDRFAQFVPAQPVKTDRIVSDDTVFIPTESATSTSEAAAQELVTAFFDTYTPTPEQFNPMPRPRPVAQSLPVQAQPRHPQPQMEPAQNAHGAFETQAPRPRQPVAVNWRPEPSRAVFLKPATAAPAPQPRQPEAIPVLEPQRGMEHHETENWLAESGGEQIQNWLGLPYDVRWFSDFPAEALPVMFEQWITDPYDQALMISYAIWPWEVTEYMPLGSSDWMLQKFLGASLFSWYRPAGSERMIRWQTQPEGSERVHWLRPQGASEQHWSGSLQPTREQSVHPWEIWPQKPGSAPTQAPPAPALALASGSGFFRA